MPIVARIKKGAYFDSVTLMTVGRKLGALPGVEDAAVVMGTQENRRILAASGLLSPALDGAGDSDLLIAVKLSEGADEAKLLAAVDAELAAARKRPAAREGALDERPRSLEAALKLRPGARLALISIAGRYAAAEARKALEAGLHVMLFSDNVPLEQEVELKRYAAERDLLVMGPDCGTAIINGVPLAFANAVSRGPIGVVAAAGTGLQEVSCIISNAGSGISQAIGTGGRDVKKDVGGIMFLKALEALDADEMTRVILLVSKPPHPDVLAKIEAAVATSRKPVVSLFLGADAKDATTPSTLEEAALTAVALSRGEKPSRVRKQLAAREETIGMTAKARAASLPAGRRYLRGLFSGGTFCAEAQLVLEQMGVETYSNAPAGTARKLEDSLRSAGHTVVDLGEDEFTVGRPHPMIDYSLRKRRFAQEAADSEVAVILLDVVLGYGAHPDPASELAELIARYSSEVAIVCSVTGTVRDPQNRERVEEALRDAGAHVMPTNAAACKLAGTIVRYVKE